MHGKFIGLYLDNISSSSHIRYELYAQTFLFGATKTMRQLLLSKTSFVVPITGICKSFGPQLIALFFLCHGRLSVLDFEDVHTNHFWNPRNYNSAFSCHVFVNKPKHERDAFKMNLKKSVLVFFSRSVIILMSNLIVFTKSYSRLAMDRTSKSNQSGNRTHLCSLHGLAERTDIGNYF